MQIVFISDGQYPDQHAAAIRHSTLAKGVAEMGHEVLFLIQQHQNWNSQSIVVDGVKYNSVSKYQTGNRFLKRILFYYDVFLLRKALIELVRNKSVDSIVCFSINNFIIRPVLKICEKDKILIYHERTELPYVVGSKDSFFSKKYSIYLEKLVPKFNGVFVISSKLKDFFSNYNSNVIKLPTVVDIDFFKNSRKAQFDFEYIAYCGTMSGTKDGMPVLIDSFNKLSKVFPDIRLVLVGNNDPQVIQETLEMIDRFFLSKKIIFTGLIERNEMPVILANAKLLVVAKPSNEQNSGNFPIKVGEYLATGVPVVLTKVGEIPDYIEDGVSGFLAEPDSTESFYQKMFEALSDYDRAKVIGEKGAEVAKKFFDYKIQSATLVNEIQKFK